MQCATSVRGLGMIALFTGLAILTPHNQMVYYLRSLSIPSRSGSPAGSEEPSPSRRSSANRNRRRRGGARPWIGALQFFPFYAYLDYAARGVARGYEYATSTRCLRKRCSFLPAAVLRILDAYWDATPSSFIVSTSASWC